MVCTKIPAFSRSKILPFWVFSLCEVDPFPLCPTYSVKLGQPCHMGVWPVSTLCLHGALTSPLYTPYIPVNPALKPPGLSTTAPWPPHSTSMCNPSALTNSAGLCITLPYALCIILHRFAQFFSNQKTLFFDILLAGSFWAGDTRATRQEACRESFTQHRRNSLPSLVKTLPLNC